MTSVARAPGPWYLAFLGYLGLQPLFDPDAGPLLWAATALGVLGYLAVWLVIRRRPPPQGHRLPALVTAIGLLVVPLNIGGTVLFVYAAGHAGALLPRRLALRWLVGLSVLTAAGALVSSVPTPYLLLSTVAPLVSMWIVGLATAEERAHDRAMAAEQARVEHLSTLAERERIARDLHDLVGHTLTGIVVRTQLARRLPPDEAAGEMAAVEALARTALDEVRAAVTGWRQAGLDAEITAATAALAAAGVALTVHRDPDLGLDPATEHAMALALREAVTNVVRHAAAGHCTVTLRAVGERVRLDVADDGAGGTDAPEGTGLSGMRERVAALGGEVRRRRPAGTGTVLEVALPRAGGP